MKINQLPKHNAPGFFPRFFRHCFGLFTLALMLALAAPGLKAGDIEGFVIDANTGRYLPGVEVVVLGEGRMAVTDRDGSYRVPDLPAGTYTVQIRYIGYSPINESVTVPQTGSATLSVDIGLEFVELPAFRVEGYREGRALALQQKRTAGNILDIISADSVGSLPDRNVAEALARITGVSLDVDAGEGRFVSIRGLEPNFNNVTLDGAILSAPSAGGREGRAMPLDVVGSGQIYQLEVIKSVTPDMDGNALGGTINIKSTSAFDKPDRFIFGKIEMGKNSDRDNSLFDGDITWGDTFNDGTVGIALSAHYSDRPFTSQEIQANYGNQDGRYFVETFELQPAEGERVRTGLNYNIEFKPDQDSEFFVRGIYNDFNQEEQQQEYIMDTRRDPEFLTSTAADFNRMRMEQRNFSREIDQSLFNLSIGGRREFETLTVSGDMTYSLSEEDVPFIKTVQFRSGNINFVPERFFYEFSGLYPNFDAKGFNSSNNPGDFPLRRYREDDSFSKEEIYAPRIDFEWENEDFLGGRTTFKTGAKMTSRKRFVDDNSTRPVGDFTMAEIAPPAPNSGFPIYGGRYMYPSHLDLDQALAYLNANRSRFEIDPGESLSNSLEDDYDIAEDILAVYLMGTIQAAEDLSIIAGFRWEQTDADLGGPEFQDGPDGGVEVQNQNDFSYDNLLPNFQMRYEIDGQTILRGAITGTIGRPQYEKASPKAVLEYERLPAEDVISPGFDHIGELEIGNPLLSPYESINLDLTLERYLQSGGLLSAGIFFKEIDNPIYQFNEDRQNYTHNGIGFENLSVTEERNAVSASINGLEIAAQIPFSTFFEDTFLDGFGVDLNATFISSDVTVTDREEDALPFFRQPENIYNVALYYQKHKLQARIAYNFQDESLRELSGGADSDRWDDTREYTDVQASYAISDNYSIYANWQNIFEAEKITTYGRATQRLRRGEFYGSYVRAGIRYNW